MTTVDLPALDVTPTIPSRCPGLEPMGAAREDEIITAPHGDVRLVAWGNVEDVGLRRLWLERRAALGTQLLILDRVLEWDDESRGGRSSNLRRVVGAVEAILRSLGDVYVRSEAAEGRLHVAHPFVRYVDSVYGWLVTLVVELKDLAVQEATTQARLPEVRRSIAEYSASYVLEYLEPLHRKVLGAALGPTLSPFPELRCAESTLHGDIIWLNWELGSREAGER